MKIGTFMKTGIVDFFSLREGWGQISYQENGRDCTIDFKLSTHRALELRGHTVSYLGPEIDGPPYPVPDRDDEIVFWPSKQNKDHVFAWAYKFEADEKTGASGSQRQAEHRPEQHGRNGKTVPPPSEPILDSIPVVDGPPPKAIVEAPTKRRAEIPTSRESLAGLATAYDSSLLNGDKNGQNGDGHSNHSRNGSDSGAWRQRDKPEEESSYSKKRKRRLLERQAESQESDAAA